MASSNTDLEKQINAIAHLALQIDGGDSTKSVGANPSDEELCALYENTLDATRRAQILQFIANDSLVHQRWIRCVTSLTLLEESEQTKTEAETGRTKPGIFDKLSVFFTIKTASLGAVSTAVAFILVLTILPPQNDTNIQLSLNDAYTTWGSTLETEWASLSVDLKPTKEYSSDRSFFTKPKDKSNIQQTLETGFKITLNQIGAEPFKDYGIDVKNLASVSYSDIAATMTLEQFKGLIQTGQITALATLQCTLNPNSDRLTTLSHTLPILYQELKSLSNNQAKELISLMKQGTKSALCLSSTRVISIITE